MTEEYRPPLPDPEGVASPATSYGEPVEYGSAGSTGATETYASAGAGSGSSGGDQSTTDVAKDQAANVAGSAKQAGQQVASTAMDQAGNVAAEAGRQTKDLLKQAQSELSDQAASQQQRLAEGVKSLGGELRSMANNNDQPGVATQLAHQGADLAEQVSSWLSERDPARLLSEVRSFARQRPGTFLLLAAGAGVVAGRLTRGVKDAASSDDESGSAGTSGSTRSAVGSYEPVPATSGYEPVPTGNPGYDPVADYPATTSTPYGDLGSPAGGDRL